MSGCRAEGIHRGTRHLEFRASNFKEGGIMSTEMIATDSITIDAAPSLVWDALVNPLMTRKYMSDCEALSDWKPDRRDTRIR